MPEPMTSSTFICPVVRCQLPAGFTIRPLEESDYDKGMPPSVSLLLGILECLGELTKVGYLTKAQFQSQFTKLHNENYVMVVIENQQERSIAACGTLFIEHKFIHARGKVGHIEDIVVRQRYRGKNFGKFIIEQLKVSGRLLGCYKIILDCSKANVPFYEKCGFREKERQMVLYYEQNDASSGTALESKL